MDSIDLEHIEQTCRTQGYGLLVERYRQMLDEARAELETAKEHQIGRLQERIFVLRRVLVMPAVLAQEAKTSKPARPTRTIR